MTPPTQSFAPPRVDPPAKTPIAPNVAPPAVTPGTDSHVYVTPPGNIIMPPLVPWTLPGSGRAIMLMTIPIGDSRGRECFARLTDDDWKAWLSARSGKLMTEALARDIDARGLHLEPCILPAGPDMASLAYANREDACIWAQLKARGFMGTVPVSNCGKDWIAPPPGYVRPATSPPGTTLNFGWLSPSAPNGYAYQSVGSKHNGRHTDYSQLCRGYFET